MGPRVRATGKIPGFPVPVVWGAAPVHVHQYLPLAVNLSLRNRHDDLAGFC